MYVVVWTSHGQRYATPAAAIVEVIPMVQSRPIPGSHAWLVGLFDYRGELLPLFDAARLIGDQASTIRMSSRILVVASDNQKDHRPSRGGLMVEHVLGSERLDDPVQAAAGHSSSPAVGFLGPVALTPAGTIQLTDPSRLPWPEDNR